MGIAPFRNDIPLQYNTLFEKKKDVLQKKRAKAIFGCYISRSKQKKIRNTVADLFCHM